MHSGPLPPPGMLRAYDDVLPGSAERLMAMAEREQSHRHKREDAAAQVEIDDRRKARQLSGRGQVFGFVVAIIGIGGGTAATVFAPTTAGAAAGGIIAGATLVGLVGAFVAGRRPPPRE